MAHLGLGADFFALFLGVDLLDLVELGYVVGEQLGLHSWVMGWIRSSTKLVDHVRGTPHNQPIAHLMGVWVPVVGSIHSIYPRRPHPMDGIYVRRINLKPQDFIKNTWG